MNRRTKIIISAAVLIVLAVSLYAARNIYDARKPVAVQPKTNIPADQSKPDRKISSGEFIRIDAIHNASGQAVIYDGKSGPVLSFENYKNSPGPDLFVYLSKNENITKLGSEVGDYISLGHLKALEGSQTYALPADYKYYKSVVIWCRAFSVNFSSAALVSL